MKNICLTIFILFSFLKTYSQNVNIPDAKFKSLLLGSNAINENGDDEISYAEAEAFTARLDVAYEDIYDLTGIEAFTSLTELYCGFNNLTSLDVSKNVALVELSIFYNDIGSIDLSNNELLTGINCINAGLTNLDLTKNVNLVEIYADENNLATLDLSENINLEILDVGENQLTELDLSNNVNLREVDCDDNLLSSINIDQNVALTNFNCFRNQLTNLNVSNNVNLNVLSCSDNMITELDISKNTELDRFACYSNQVSQLDFGNNLMLTSIFCDNNQLSTLDFSANDKLDFLSVHSNNLINLNIKNGNNTILEEMYAFDNPMLECIQVDDVAWSNENWTSIDDITQFDVECPLVSNLDDLITQEHFNIYPNPSFDFIYIDEDIKTSTFEIYNMQGQQVMKSLSINKKINIKDLEAGIYLIKTVPHSKNGISKFIKL